MNQQSGNPLLSFLLTDEGTGVPYSTVPHVQGYLDRLGPVICAGWCSGLAHLVGLFMGCHGASHLLHHLRHQHGSLCLLCPYQTGKSLGPTLQFLALTDLK